MKKKMIAAGAASLALAAMPVVGVFADSNITDYVELTVTGSCTMTATPISDGDDADDTATYDFIDLGTIAPGGQTHTGTGNGSVTGTPMSFTCNTENGFTLAASATPLEDGQKPDINFGNYNTATGSIWSAKVTVTGADAANLSIASGWDDWTATSPATTIVSLNSDSAVSNVVVTPYYRAKAAANQPAGTYQGNITYTFAEISAQQQP